MCRETIIYLKLWEVFALIRLFPHNFGLRLFPRLFTSSTINSLPPSPWISLLLSISSSSNLWFAACFWFCLFCSSPTTWDDENLPHSLYLVFSLGMTISIKDLFVIIPISRNLYFSYSFFLGISILPPLLYPIVCYYPQLYMILWMCQHPKTPFQAQFTQCIFRSVINWYWQ